jgi:predicted Zn finger-like uncharacterized protein
MNIQCPACHASARLPESKEGAKVRCGGCGHVYVARERGARRAKSTSPTPFILGGALLVAIVVVLVIANSSDESVAGAAAPVEIADAEPAPVREGRGWESAPVRATRALHDAAFARDSIGLMRLVDRERVYALEQLPPAPGEDSGDEAEDAGETPGDEPADDVAPSPSLDLSAGSAAWLDLPRDEQVAYQTDLMERIIAGAEDDDELVAAWKPFDGEWVETTDDGVAIVRVKVQPRDAERGLETRTVEWWLAKDATDRWQAFRWARWISPEEAKAGRIATVRLDETVAKRVTLTDGSTVREAEVRPLEHLETTPPELRAEIDELFVQMIDLSLSPKDSNGARERLIEIGKPSIPVLLTGFYRIPLETEEQAKQVNMIVQALRGITGQNFGFKPQVAEGSGTGTTDERRESALKQWFAWWHLKGQRFEEKVLGPDLLDETVIPTPAEQRMMERFEKEKKRDNP